MQVYEIENARQSIKRIPTTPKMALRRAIIAATRNGATYQWITGVLAGCLAADTTTPAARALAINTLQLAAITPASPPKA